MLTGLFKDVRFIPFSNLHTCISLVVVRCFGQCLGWRFSPIYIFSLACFRAFRDAPHSQFWCRHLKLCLLDFFKMVDWALSQIYTRVFLVKVYRFWRVFGSEILAHINFLFSRKFSRVQRCATLAVQVQGSKPMHTSVFKAATFSPSVNLHTCILLLENYRFGQCLSERFSPLSTFFSLVSSRAFKEAPHSRFRRGDPNQCLRNFLKMLLLALPEIYTRVFHLWRSFDLESTWVTDSRHYQLSFRQ